MYYPSCSYHRFTFSYLSFLFPKRRFFTYHGRAFLYSKYPHQLHSSPRYLFKHFFITWIHPRSLSSLCDLHHSTSIHSDSSAPFLKEEFGFYFQNNDPKGLLNFAESHKPAIAKCLPSYFFFTGVLWALGEAGMPESCLNILEEMRELRDIHAWNFYIIACGNNRDPERLRRVVHQLKVENISFNVDTYAKLIFAYIKCAEFDRALMWFHEFKNFCASNDLQPLLPFSDFFKILQFCINLKRLSEIKELYEDLHLYPDIDLLYRFEFLRAFIDADQFELAKECFSKLTSTLEGSSNHYLDIGLLNRLLEISGRFGDPLFASELLLRMSANDIPVSLHQFTCLIQALAHQRDYISLFQLLPSIRSMGWNPYKVLHQLIPPFDSLQEWSSVHRWLFTHSQVDPATFTVLIQGAAHLGIHQHGLDIFESCVRRFHVTPEIQTYHAALMCTQSHEQGKREQLVLSMRQHGIATTETTVALNMTYGTVAEAWGVFKEAKEHGHASVGLSLLLLAKYLKSPDPRDVWDDIFDVFLQHPFELPADVSELLESFDIQRYREYKALEDKGKLAPMNSETKFGSAKDLFLFHPFPIISRNRSGPA